MVYDRLLHRVHLLGKRQRGGGEGNPLVVNLRKSATITTTRVEALTPKPARLVSHRGGNEERKYYAERVGARAPQMVGSVACTHCFWRGVQTQTARMNKYTNKSGAVFTPLQTVGAVDGMLLQPAHLLHCTKAPPPPHARHPEHLGSGASANCSSWNARR